VRNRQTLIHSLSTAANMCEDIDGALREVCAALLRNDGVNLSAAEAEPAEISEDALQVAAYLDSGPKGFAVPRDLGVLPAEALRSLVRGR
jgi:hypothetical protein